MGLEAGTYIDDLNSSWPVGGDPKSQGDDHIRLIKAVLQNTFPAIAGAVTATHDELNALTGVTSNLQDQLDTITAGGGGGGGVVPPAASQAEMEAGTEGDLRLVSPLRVKEAIYALGIPKVGGTMTGLLTLSGAPTAASHAATKAYVDGLAGGGSGLPGQTGNAGKYLQTNGTVASWVAFSSAGVGVNQSWQNVQASRASDTWYQNSTSAPIMVSVTSEPCLGDGCSNLRQLQVGPTTLSYVTAAETELAYSAISCVVPAGHYYRHYVGGAIAALANWAELR